MHRRDELVAITATEHQCLDLFHGAVDVDLRQLLSLEDLHRLRVNLDVELVSPDENFDELLSIDQNEFDKLVQGVPCDFTDGTQHVFVLLDLFRLGIDDLLDEFDDNEELLRDFCSRERFSCELHDFGSLLGKKLLLSFSDHFAFLVDRLNVLHVLNRELFEFTSHNHAARNRPVAFEPFDDSFFQLIACEFGHRYRICFVIFSVLCLHLLCNPLDESQDKLAKAPKVFIVLIVRVHHEYVHFLGAVAIAKVFPDFGLNHLNSLRVEWKLRLLIASLVILLRGLRLSTRLVISLVLDNDLALSVVSDYDGRCQTEGVFVLRSDPLLLACAKVEGDLSLLFFGILVILAFFEPVRINA